MALHGQTITQMDNSAFNEDVDSPNGNRTLQLDDSGGGHDPLRTGRASAFSSPPSLRCCIAIC